MNTKYPLTHCCCESPCEACYLKMSAALRRKSCSCWLLSALIPLSISASSGSTKPNTRGLPACRATNTSMRSNTYISQTKTGSNIDYKNISAVLLTLHSPTVNFRPEIKFYCWPFNALNQTWVISSFLADKIRHWGQIVFYWKCPKPDMNAGAIRASLQTHFFVIALNAYQFCDILSLVFYSVLVVLIQHTFLISSLLVLFHHLFLFILNVTDSMLSNLVAFGMLWRDIPYK